MGLLKPIWMTKNLKKRDKAIAAVQRLEDAIQLENAAINAPMEAVAQAACSRIMDQATLAEVAIHASWRRVATQAAFGSSAPPTCGRYQTKGTSLHRTLLRYSE